MTTAQTLSLGSMLRRHRMAAGLTQEELAAKAGVSARTISDLERGLTRRSHPDTLRLLADALRLHEDDRTLLLKSARQARRAETPVPTLEPFTSVGEFPLTLTPLIGREREKAAIAHLLLHDGLRLLTLTGPAGIGKTRLATEVAVGLGAHFATLVFTSLTAISDPALVIPAIAQALGMYDQPSQPAREQLYEYLSHREVLLVLDNFEQVVQAGPVVARLLATCPQVKALVTSRVALRVRGEQEFPVPPLDVPNLRHLPALEDLTRYAAVALFVQRARAVKPKFAVTPTLAPVIAAICARLDGIPLALELAAARIELLPPQALLARLDTSLALLTNGPIDLPERQQTMRRAIAWSYDLLNASQQRLFRQLAVFVDGWTLEAAEAVCGQNEAPGAPGASVLDDLAGLVSSSLVVQVEERGEEAPRFRLLELMREYGWEQLVAQDELSALRTRHANYYRALAEEAAPEMNGPNQRLWLARLAQEHPNLRAALGWARETHSIECGLRLGSALYWFWRLHGHASEGRAWLEHFLFLQSSQQPPARDGDRMVRADTLLGAGQLAWVQGDHEAATAWLAESLDLYRAQSNLPGIAHVLNIQGMIADERGDYARGVALFEESLALWRKLGSVSQIGALLNDLACAEYQQERFVRAKTLLEEGLALQRAANNYWSIAMMLCNLGDTLRMQGDLAAAAALIEEGVELYRDLCDRGVLASPLVNLAEVVREQGDLERAARLNYEALTIASEVGPRFAVVDALDSMAEIGYSQGRVGLATQVFAVATLLRETHHLPRLGRHAKLCATRFDALRATLGDEAFANAWERGKKLSVDEAIHLMSMLLSIPEPMTTSEHAGGRTEHD